MQVAEAAKLWDGTGALVFTSSAGLYEVDDGSHCNEDCKIADRGSSDRTDKWVRESNCHLWFQTWVQKHTEEDDYGIWHVPVALDFVRQDMGSKFQHMMLSIVPLSKRFSGHGACWITRAPSSYRVYFLALGCRLLGAEEAILKAGGIVIRLVGLYHAGRWLHAAASFHMHYKHVLGSGGMCLLWYLCCS